MPRRKRRGSAAARVRDFLRRFIAFLFSNVGVVVLVVAYTIAGAFMFQAIEGASEMQRANMMDKERESLVQHLWRNLTVFFNEDEASTRESLRKNLLLYQDKIVVAVRRGWDGGRSSRQWSFSSAFLYSLTVITTIGYGHLSPRTNWGKIVTIFYSLLGMPLFLLYLTNVGELLARWCKCLYALVCMCRGCPGFSRRRIVRLRSQLELSDAESIERPEHWRDFPYWHAVDYAREDARHFAARSCRNMYYDCSNYRPPAHRFRSTEFGPDDRYYSYSGRYPSKGPTRGMPERIPLGRIPERLPFDRFEWDKYQDFRNLQRNRPYQRRAEYLRSASVPQPSYCPRPQRGWSEPARMEDQASSDFSYVTFDAQTITVPVSVCVALMVGYLMFGSMIFGLWEKWDQLDGAYFCFISLSSIGFGDFVPGERVFTPHIETSFIVCSMYLMLGMALVAMCFNLMQEQVIHYVAGLKRAVKRVCRCRCKR